MSWQDDIKQVSYESPSGKEFTWLYEGVSVTVDKKTTEFRFAEKDGVYIQDNGIAGRKFPFTCYFVGDTYNETADEFLLALEERGIAKLQHPLYGDRNVVPTGQISRRDDLVTAANQAIFTVTFSETIKDIFFPSSEVDATESINSGLDDTQDVQSKKFSLDIARKTVGDQTKLATRMAKQLQTLNKKTKELIAFSEDIKTQYDTVAASYENAIDTVFDNAETVASQGLLLARLPAKVESDFKLKAEIYNDMFVEIANDFANALLPDNDSNNFPNNNNFFETNKNLISYNLALCEAVLFSSFGTRSEAVEASESILVMLDDLKDFQDSYLDGTLDTIDTGEDYESLLKLISEVTGYLISISFDLPSQKILVLGEETNIIPLCAELYGNLEQLDYFIDTNNFNCDTLEILPIGKEVIYYE
jgi:hypothetical protein